MPALGVSALVALLALPADLRPGETLEVRAYPVGLTDLQTAASVVVQTAHGGGIFGAEAPACPRLEGGSRGATRAHIGDMVGSRVGAVPRRLGLAVSAVSSFVPV